MAGGKPAAMLGPTLGWENLPSHWYFVLPHTAACRSGHKCPRPQIPRFPLFRSLFRDGDRMRSIRDDRSHCGHLPLIRAMMKKTVCGGRSHAEDHDRRR